jgi:hypothetical protein
MMQLISKRLGRRDLWPVGAALLLIAALAALLAPLPSGGPGRASAGKALAGAEVWRIGVLSEGVTAYETVAGRVVSSTASFRAQRSTPDMYFIFPAPATSRVVSSAAVLVVERSGTGAAPTTLEVRGLDGSLRRTISTAPVDVSTLTVGTWADVPLVGDAASRTLAPGEYLAFHAVMDANPADIRPVFEVVVE